MFRRGKFSFLTTKDDRIKIINDRINLTEKHLVEMCSTFATSTRKMAKCRDSYDELAKGFKSYGDDEEINESLSEGLKSFANATTILADYMDLEVHRMDLKIINELAQFEGICKTTRDNLRSAVIARDKEVLRQRQMLEIKSKFAANTSAADSELLKAKLEVNRTNKEIDEIINNFEKRKLHDLKTILGDFILIKMKHHTKALEALTATYYDIAKIDEQHDLQEFQKLMHNKESDAQRKVALTKSLRSQSMESLDRDQLLSPARRRARISRSTKNLATHSTDERDDVDEEDESEEDTNQTEEEDDSASATEGASSESESENSAPRPTHGKKQFPRKQNATVSHINSYTTHFKQNAKPLSSIGIPSAKEKSLLLLSGDAN